MKNLNTISWVAAFLITAAFTISCDQEHENPRPAESKASKKSSDSELAFLKSNSASQNRLLAEIRRATARYHRVEVAEDDGYIQVSECVSSPMGGMGYHYQNMEYLMDGVVDPSRPEFLVYEPMKNGKLRLVAVEFMIIAAAWDASNGSAPMLGHKEFDDHRPAGSGGPPFPHYQLHVWVWKNNPAGMYAPFNPEVSCQFAQ